MDDIRFEVERKFPGSEQEWHPLASARCGSPHDYGHPRTAIKVAKRMDGSTLLAYYRAVLVMPGGARFVLTPVEKVAS